MIITLAPSASSYSTDPTAQALRSVQATAHIAAARRDAEVQSTAPSRLHISPRVAAVEAHSPAPCRKVWRPAAIAQALTVCVPIGLAVALLAGFQ